MSKTNQKTTTVIWGKKGLTYWYPGSRIRTVSVFVFFFPLVVSWTSIFSKLAVTRVVFSIYYEKKLLAFTKSNIWQTIFSESWACGSKLSKINWSVKLSEISSGKTHHVVTSYWNVSIKKYGKKILADIFVPIFVPIPFL